MSSDSRKPFDAPPATMPPMLNKDLRLDRRTVTPAPLPQAGPPGLQARPSTAAGAPPPPAVPPMRPPAVARAAVPVAPPQMPQRAPVAPAALAQPVLEAPTLMQDAPAPIDAAVAPTEVVALGEAVPSTHIFASPASLFRRIGAWCIDGLAVSGLAIAFVWGAITALGAGGDGLFQTLERLAAPVAGLIGLIAVVYATLFAFLWQGRTVGRRALGISLVDGTGRPPSPGVALRRALWSLVSFALFFAGFWLALFDRRGQTLHDKLARTFVVRLDVGAS